MLNPGKTYEEVYRSFRWHIPDLYNIGVDICDKNAHQRRRTALIYEKDTGEVKIFTFQDLKRFSNRLANAFNALGLQPGERVGILLPQCPETAIGHIAIRRPDPVMFLEYWNNPEATRNKFVGSWCLTGDMGRRDLDGYLWFVGRQDDLITSAEYRIGPGEIEDCLIKHPAVAMAAVIGVPDELRTEIVKAFVVLKPGAAGSVDLKSDIQNHVRNRLAAHEYPRDIAFVDELPMTATGKIIRRELRRREISNHT
jgi:acyl-coenzyme A synthetase/AMP-(fatty) acid ligase